MIDRSILLAYGPQKLQPHTRRSSNKWPLAVAADPKVALPSRRTARAVPLLVWGHREAALFALGL